MASSATDLQEVFTGLDIQPSAEPMPEIRRGSAAGPNPFIEPLKASVTHTTPYSVYLPPDAIQRAVFLINVAAKKENLGARVWVNCQRDDKGGIIRGGDGKAQYVVEGRGENKGKVLLRFQGKAERKQQSAPRTHSIVKDKQDETKYHVRERSSGNVVFTGTKEQAKAHYDEVKKQAQAQSQPAEQ